MATSNGNRLVRLAGVGLILAACVGCDQLTKHVAQSHLKGRPTASYFGDVHGSADYKHHLTYYFAEQIRAELGGKR